MGRSGQTATIWDADCLSEEHEVSDMASYLQVDTDTWFDWSEEAREEYVRKFSNWANYLGCHEREANYVVVATKREGENQAESAEWKEFSDDVKALLDLKEAENLLNTRDAIQRMPSFGADGFCKYLVVAKGYKTDGECTSARCIETTSPVTALLTNLTCCANTVYASQKIHNC